MKHLTLALFSTLIALPAFAGVDGSCKKSLEETAQKFISQNAKLLTGQNFENISVQLKNPKNTTPGTYDQLYEMGATLSWPSRHPQYPFVIDVMMTFYSPFICDRLQLRGYEKLVE